MIQSMKYFFIKAFQFKGRASRKDYWMPTIFLVLLSIVMRFFKSLYKWENVIMVISILPSLSLTSRRYQDAGVSGWFQLPQLLSFLLLPFVFMDFVKKWMKTVVIIIVTLLNTLGFMFTLMPGKNPSRQSSV